MRSWQPFSKQYRYFYIMAIIVALSGSTWCLVNYILDGHVFAACLSKMLFGVPCPGCGLTRACVALAHADIASAIYYNINALLFLPFVVVFYTFVAYDLVTNHTVTYDTCQRICSITLPTWLATLIITVFLAMEVYVEVHNITHCI